MTGYLQQILDSLLDDTLPHLMMTWGSGNKPVKQVRCHDVHHGPIPHGSSLCCGVCHCSGRDDHPLLQKMPSDEQPCRTAQTPHDGLAGGTGKVPKKEASRCVH